MKIITAVIEVRMTSSRLPGKVMLKAGNKPMLQILIERIRKSVNINEIVVATTTNKEDDIIENFCKKFGVNCYRGDEHNVLDRVCQASLSVNTDILIEIPGDNILLDPKLLDYAIDIFIKKYPNCKYVSNAESVPSGLDVRLFAAQDLYDINNNNPDKLDREHVSYSFYRKDKKNNYSPFFIKYEGELNRPEIHVEIDYYEDYLLIRAIYEELNKQNPNFDAISIIRWLDAHPELRDLPIKIRERKKSS